MLQKTEYKVNGAATVAYDALNLGKKKSILHTCGNGITYVRGTGYNSHPDSIAINFGGWNRIALLMYYMDNS